MTSWNYFKTRFGRPFVLSAHGLFKLRQKRWSLLTYLSFLISIPFLAEGRHDATFSLDLRQFGWKARNSHSFRVDYSNVTFLSDSLLLVIVNQKSFVEPLAPETKVVPNSKLFIFDLHRREVSRTADVPALQLPQSVLATRSGKFAMLSIAGLQLCSAQLDCGTALHTPGPMAVSPRGSKIIIGGYAGTRQTLVDADTMKPIEELPGGELVIPGDIALLVHKEHYLYLQKDHTQVPLPLSVFPAQFVNDQLIVGFRERDGAVVFGSDGLLRYTLAAKNGLRNREIVFTTCSSGTRFVISESGYTKGNSLVHFLDIDQARPLNYQRIRVVDSDTGRIVFDKTLDPGAYLTWPALSPDAHTFAMLTNGKVEVFELP